MERKMENVAEKIKELRTKKGLSQEKLGKRIGVSRQTVMRWEGGTSHPNMSDIEHMCALFNVPINYFSTAAEVAATNSDARPDTKITVESNCEPQVSVSCSQETETEIKKKPWKSLVVAIVFTVATVIPLIFSIITGMVAFSATQGDDVVFDYYFDFWSFFVSLILAILCFIVAAVGWIRYIMTKMGQMYQTWYKK